MTDPGPLEQALQAPPAADADFVNDVVTARDRALRPAIGPRVVVVGVAFAAVLGVVALVRLPVRFAEASLARARLALLAVDDAHRSRGLLSGDVLAAGEAVVPGVLVVRSDPTRTLLVAAVDDQGVVTWLDPADGTCPPPGRAVGLTAGLAAVPRGRGAFDVVLVDVEGCDAERLALLQRALVRGAPTSTSQPPPTDLPPLPAAAAVIDAVVIRGVR